MTFDPGVGTAEQWEAHFPLAKATDARAAQAVATTGLAALAREMGGPNQAATLGPGTPIAPFHQDEIEPRRWDYVPGYNIQQTPRAFEPISFQMLRTLGRDYDVANLARQ